MQSYKTRYERKRATMRRMQWLWVAIALFTIIMFSLAPLVQAQNYLFSVPELKMDVHVQRDASVYIAYDITFENHGDPIDIVDIGLPHSNYNFSTMSASIDGMPLDDIRTSEYIATGVEVHLEEHAIPPGQQGRFRFECVMPDMVYQDTTNGDNASLRITPTWFDSSVVQGTSSIQIAIYAMPGITLDELLYQDEKAAFTNKEMLGDQAVAFWQWEQTSATHEHLVGISFPKRGMDRVVEMSAFTLLMKWAEENLAFLVPIIWLANIVAFGFLFFRFTGGTGFGIFVFLLVFLGSFLVEAQLAPCVLPILLLLIAGNEAILRRRKRKYLPAVVQVEGGGIKRGLAAPEAAVLLEIPRTKVLMLVLFGMLKKGVLQQVQASPLKVKIIESFRGTKDERTKVAQQKGVVLHAYEHAFLDILEKESYKAVHKIDFKDAMENLIKHTVKRVKGFDLSDTQDYYRTIIKRAMEQAESIGDIPEREKNLDRNLEWIIMNDRYDRPFEMSGHTYRPVWMRTSLGGIGASSSSGGGIGGSSKGPSDSGSTSFGDVAGSFAGWTENTMGKMADAVSPDFGGILDLSKLESSSGGGGGGSGCACACAGCACACACAGGGR